MLKHILKYLSLLFICVVIAIWFAENPGHLVLEWQGFIVEVPIALAVIVCVVVIAVSAFLYRLWLMIRRSPKIYGHYRAEQKLHKGYDSLSKGMVAVAAGDAIEARKHAARAGQFLQNPALTMLLRAQAAQLDGDENAARLFFEEMSKTKGMEFLGKRGLLNQALAENNKVKALEIAKQVYALKPKTKWVNDTLLDLQISQRLWKEADVTLKHLKAKKLVDEETYHSLYIALLCEEAREEAAKKNEDTAIKLLTQAFKLDKGKSFIILDLVRLLAQNNKAKRAIGLIENAWMVKPHPDLFPIYLELHPNQEALKQVQYAEHLASFNRTHEESRLIIAEAALKAQLWGEARDELNILLKEAPSARVYRLMSELVETENADLSAAREWLRRAVQAQADPLWVCQSCGDVSYVWSGVCKNCEQFNTKEWKSPAQPEETQLSLSKETTVVDLDVVKD